MELVEVEQEVTDLLLTALEFSDNPPAAMVFCRQATECITHNLHYQEFGVFPKQDERGKYPSLPDTVKRVKEILEKQTSEVLYSINAQSRGSLHWDFESRGKGAKKHHVEMVVKQISNTFNDIYGEELTLTGMNITDDELEETVKNTVSQELTKQGFTKDSKPSEDEVNTDDLDKILDVAESASVKGIEFDYWEQYGLGRAAEIAGRFELAEGYYKQALRGFKNIQNQMGEWNCLSGLGIIEGERGNLDEAEILFKESLAICQELGDQSGTSMSLGNLGNVAEKRRDWDEAERLQKESLAICQDMGRREGVLSCLSGLGIIAAKRGDLDEAERLQKESLAGFQELEDLLGTSISLGNLGIVAAKRRDWDEAERLQKESLAICRVLGHRLGEAKSLDALGGIARERGDLDEAESLHKESLPIYQEVGDQIGEAGTFTSLGNLARRRGDLDEAESLHKESIAIFQGVEWSFGEYIGLYNLGECAFDRGDLDEAERLLREHVRMSYEIGSPLRQWLVDNGYTDPDAPWDFSPDSEFHW